MNLDIHAVPDRSIPHAHPAGGDRCALHLPDGASLVEVAELVCQRLPADYVLSLRMEAGAAWVEVERNMDAAELKLADPADKSLVEQLCDGLRAAIADDCLDHFLEELRAS